MLQWIIWKATMTNPLSFVGVCHSPSTDSTVLRINAKRGHRSREEKKRKWSFISSFLQFFSFPYFNFHSLFVNVLLFFFWIFYYMLILWFFFWFPQKHTFQTDFKKRVHTFGLIQHRSIPFPPPLETTFLIKDQAKEQPFSRMVKNLYWIFKLNM